MIVEFFDHDDRTCLGFYPSKESAVETVQKKLIPEMWVFPRTETNKHIEDSTEKLEKGVTRTLEQCSRTFLKGDNPDENEDLIRKKQRKTEQMRRG